MTRVLKAQSRVFEALAGVSNALAANQPQLAERRLPRVHAAAAAMSEEVAKLRRADDAPAIRRRNRPR